MSNQQSDQLSINLTNIYLNKQRQYEMNKTGKFLSDQIDHLYKKEIANQKTIDNLKKNGIMAKRRDNSSK